MMESRAGTLRLGDVAGGNCAEFEADGTLRFLGTACVWEDENVGGMTLTGPAVTQPSETEILDSAGAGTGIYTLGFDVGEKASGAIEIPHAYLEGSDLSFHLHFTGNAAPGATDRVRFQLTYFIVDDGVAIPPATVATAELVYDTQYQRVSLAFPDIDGSAVGMGDQLLFTVERIAATANEYAGMALLLTTGIHYERDTGGSRSVTTK